MKMYHVVGLEMLGEIVKLICVQILCRIEIIPDYPSPELPLYR